MKYGIYKSKNGNRIIVSKDLLNDKMYYVTYCVSLDTICNATTQKEFMKWLKKMGYKYTGGVV